LEEGVIAEKPASRRKLIHPIFCKSVEETRRQAASELTSTSDVVILSEKAGSRARKRVDRPSDHPAKKKRRLNSDRISEPRTVTPLDRVREFPGECLAVSNGKLFCDACRLKLSCKLSTLKNHLASNKHLISSRKRRESALKQTDLIAFVEQCQESDLLAPGEGSKLDSKQVAFRLTVLDTFLSAGCSLGKIDACRELLEHSGFALTDSSHMRQLIPVLMKNKLQTLTSMLEGRYVSIIFDGTPHVGELLMVFARFWMDGAFVQKLIIVRHHSYHPDNRTLAYTISRALSLDFRLNLISWWLLPKTPLL
jgi:hypothetical protein